MLIHFIGYLRPGELVSLRCHQLVEPVPGAGVKWWSLLLAPEQDGTPSKVGEFDETALLDKQIHFGHRAAPEAAQEESGREGAIVEFRPLGLWRALQEDGRALGHGSVAGSPLRSTAWGGQATTV